MANWEAEYTFGLLLLLNEIVNWRCDFSFVFMLIMYRMYYFVFLKQIIVASSVSCLKTIQKLKQKLQQHQEETNTNNDENQLLLSSSTTTSNSVVHNKPTTLSAMHPLLSNGVLKDILAMEMTAAKVMKLTLESAGDTSSSMNNTATATTTIKGVTNQEINSVGGGNNGSDKTSKVSNEDSMKAPTVSMDYTHHNQYPIVEFKLN